MPVKIMVRTQRSSPHKTQIKKKKEKKKVLTTKNYFLNIIILIRIIITDIYNSQKYTKGTDLCGKKSSSFHALIYILHISRVNQAKEGQF